jgi:hypothetical protein
MEVPRLVIPGGLVFDAVLVDEGFPVADGGLEFVEAEILGVTDKLLLGVTEPAGDRLARRPSQISQRLGVPLGDLPRRQRVAGGRHVPQPPRQQAAGPHPRDRRLALPGQPRRCGL